MFIDMHFRKYFIFVVSRGVLIVQIIEQNTSIIKQLMKKLDFANISFDIGHSNEEYLVTFQDKEKRAEIIIFSANLESDIHFLMQVVLINHRTDILIRSPTKIWTFDGSSSVNRHFAQMFRIKEELISTINAGEFPDPEVCCTYIQPQNSVSESQVHHQNIRLLIANGKICDDSDLLESIDQNMSEICNNNFTYFIEITCRDIIGQKPAILENILKCCRAIVEKSRLCVKNN